ncbi:hypothetical protein FO440_19140 [Mucilaginibacter corticis]|uniref:Uncharacterized protein n=1 Tax=Mucilaginibacter corticis TaxID=2597670 RepID=A0A556MFJ6_9SPHI|nr:hypothetical protein [Mucilaginibacter corticis]TSJ38630.1 hypothetical protein FO440_19140 [Mucilaginibacter corticis]
MKNTLFLLIALALLSSCTAKKPLTKTTNVVLIPPPVHETNDGSSFEKALIITATSESTGISAEYAWLYKKYPGNKRAGQSLAYHDKKPYDIIKVTTTDGKSIDTYFDISNFFGKF